MSWPILHILIPSLEPCNHLPLDILLIPMQIPHTPLYLPDNTMNKSAHPCAPLNLPTIFSSDSIRYSKLLILLLHEYWNKRNAIQYFSFNISHLLLQVEEAFNGKRTIPPHAATFYGKPTLIKVVYEAKKDEFEIHSHTHERIGKEMWYPFLKSYRFHPNLYAKFISEAISKTILKK